MSNHQDNISGTVNYNGFAIKNSGSGANRTNQDQVQDDALPLFQPRGHRRCFDDGVARVGEEDRVYQSIKSHSISALNSLGLCSQVVVIHRNSFSNFRNQANLQSFNIFSQTMRKMYGDNAKVTYAWYGGTSQVEICKIMRHGFGDFSSTGIYGRSIYLSHAGYPLGSMQSSMADEKGLTHLLLCRVILGRKELVHPGSQHSHPSSEEFDSGVDNLSSPRKFIIWSTHTNSHILKEFVIRACCQAISAPRTEPNSSETPFSMFLSQLQKVLPPCSMNLVKEYHHD